MPAVCSITLSRTHKAKDDSMENSERIPEAVIRRLPKYYRYLSDLEIAGEVRVSSSKMSLDLGLNASQIRRDLNCFGGFGQQGYGYSVDKLKSEIARILGLDKTYHVVIAGAGNIGSALVRYSNFKKHGFMICAVFDADERKVGAIIDDLEVLPMEQLEQVVQEKHASIGVICTPKEVAQATADRLMDAGVQGIWNFAPTDVEPRAGVSVENVHLNDSLFVLSYRVAEGK